MLQNLLRPVLESGFAPAELESSSGHNPGPGVWTVLFCLSHWFVRITNGTLVRGKVRGNVEPGKCPNSRGRAPRKALVKSPLSIPTCSWFHLQSLLCYPVNSVYDPLMAPQKIPKARRRVSCAGPRCEFGPEMPNLPFRLSMIGSLPGRQRTAWHTQTTLASKHLIGSGTLTTHRPKSMTIACLLPASRDRPDFNPFLEGQGLTNWIKSSNNVNGNLAYVLKRALHVAGNANGKNRVILLNQSTPAHH